MNFFEDQRAARKATNKLVILYGIAILVTAFLLAGSLIVALYLSRKTSTMPAPPLFDFFFYYQDFFYGSFGVISLVIITISLFKIMNLGQGGEYVAELAGATPVPIHTQDHLLRRYFNVVEEMSIASGTPIPKIYIMENETSINAFAAGYSIDDCVVAVTRGTLEKLNRDELQGVVAHEFSHIFNGDMKLNIKLIGYLAGILVLSQVGQIMMRSGRHSRKNGGQLALLGLAFMIIGWGGYFFASIIKAMISRQREYLADASAMQFTRNPDGIGGALKKIYIASDHGLLNATKVGEASHMFFTTAISGLFDTHPDLQDRIKRIFPKLNWTRFKKEEVPMLQKSLMNSNDSQETQTRPQAVNNDYISGFSQTIPKDQVQDRFDHIGNISQDGMMRAQSMLLEIPTEIQSIVRSETKAPSALLAFFVNEGDEIQDEVIYKVLPIINGSDGKHRFAIIELAVHTLKKLNDQQKKSILKKIKELILLDKKVTATEFVLYELIKISLFPEEKFFSDRLSQIDFFSYKQILLGLCEHISNGDNVNFSSKEISKALKGLRSSSPGQKENILKEVINIVTVDDAITFQEYEFIRLVCLSLSVPMPL